MSRGKLTLEATSWTLWLLVCLLVGHRDQQVNFRRSVIRPDAVNYEYRCARCRRREWRPK